MSPRAACRLETLGLTEVYDYIAGKADWLANNLPAEGEQADVLTAGRVARDDVVTCRLEDRVGAVRDSIELSGYGFALVTTPAACCSGACAVARWTAIRSCAPKRSWSPDHRPSAPTPPRASSRRASQRATSAPPKRCPLGQSMARTSSS
jgi:hypothetical protein